MPFNTTRSEEVSPLVPAKEQSSFSAMVNWSSVKSAPVLREVDMISISPGDNRA